MEILYIGLLPNLPVAVTVPCGGFQDFDDRFDELVLALWRKHPLTKAGLTPALLLVGPSSNPRLPFTHLLELRQSLNLGKLGLLPQVEPCRNRYSRRGIGKMCPQLGLDPLARRPSPIPCGWGSFLGLEEGNQ